MNGYMHLQCQLLHVQCLRMDDEVLRVAVGLRLGVALCRPHKCHQCGAEVDYLGLHGLSCRRSQGRHPRHAAVNELFKWSLASAKIPSLLEPTASHAPMEEGWMGSQ